MSHGPGNSTKATELQRLETLISQSPSATITKAIIEQQVRSIFPFDGVLEQGLKSAHDKLKATVEKHVQMLRAELGELQKVVDARQRSFLGHEPHELINDICSSIFRRWDLETQIAEIDIQLVAAKERATAATSKWHDD